MKRLLDYQRQMREGEEPEAPVPFGEPTRAPATDLVEDLPEETRAEPPESPSDEPAEPPADVAAETQGHWSDEGSALDDPIAARRADPREPELEGIADAAGIPEPREEPPPARRGFFRSRGSRRDVADVPSLEEATNLADVPDFDDLAPAPALTGSVAAELEARIAGFERTLQRLQTQVGELRQTFADLAVAADERLGALEDAIAKARAERFS
jgi:hypothetical protein